MNKKGKGSILFKNKKGTEKLLSIWWFFVLGIIGGGIVIGVSVYSAADVSVNQIESDILGERILNCILDEGYLVDYNSDFILERCDLDGKMFGRGSDFYFKLEIYDGEDLILSKTIEKGDFSMEKECELSLSKGAETKYFPKCFLKTEIVLGENNERLNLILLTGSNQKGNKEVFKKVI